MGSLRFGSERVEFEDRVLAHLQVAIVHLLRRDESVLLSWLDALGDGDGRSAVLLDPALPLSFEFVQGGGAEIDREWVRRLLAGAAGRSGIEVTDVDGHAVRALHSTLGR